MADKTIKVKVDVETDVEPSIAALKALKKQLRDTAAGSEEFARLQQQINDTEDAIKSAKTGASNFTEVLGQLPGPIGDIGNKVSGAVNTLKQFGGLKLTDLKASFLELGKDLTDAAKGLGDLTGITKAYTVLNNFLAASFVKVGVAEGAAAVGARALSAALIATGIGALVVLLATAASALYELATGQEAAKMAAENFNRALDSQNELLELNAKSSGNRNKVLIAQMKAQGKSEKEIRDTQLNQAYKDYQAAHQAEIEAVEFYNKNLGKTDAEQFKKMQENLDKRQAATKDSYASYLELGYNNKAEEVKQEQSKNKELAGKSKAGSDARIAERKRELAELAKGLEDARLTTLGAKEKEVEEVRIKYDTLKAKAVKYGEDTKVIEEARAKENSAIADKYAKEDLEKKIKQNEDALGLQEQQLNLRAAKGEISESEYQTNLFELRKNAAIESELLTNESLQKQQQDLGVAYATGTISLEEYNTKRIEIEDAALAKNKDFITAQVDLEKYRVDEKKKSAEEERGILAIRIQSQIEALDAENARIDGDFQQDLERLAEKRELLKEQEINDLANTELTEFQKTEIRKKYADARAGITNQEVETEKAAAKAKQDINMAYLQLFEQFGNLLGQLAGKNKAIAIAGIVISQAAAIGQIIAQTSIANAKSVAASPLTAGMPWVAINTISAGLSIASTIASAIKSIAQINSAGASAGVTGGGGGSVSSAPNIPAPKVAGAAPPEMQTTGGQNPNTQLAETLGRASAPLKAYVVSGDISSQQALDRRTSRAATFSGG